MVESEKGKAVLESFRRLFEILPTLHPLEFVIIATAVQDHLRSLNIPLTDDTNPLNTLNEDEPTKPTDR